MKEIARYAVRFHGGPKGTGEGVRASLHLFDAHRHMVGAVEFFDRGQYLPDDDEEPFIRMAMYIDQLSAVLDVLRHESPVFIGWQNRLQNAWLGTEQEPVGEGSEGDH